MLRIAIDRLPELFAKMAERKVLYLPIEKNDQVEFYPWNENEKVRLDKLNTLKSAKDLFFPQTENMMKFKLEGKNISIAENRDQVEPFVVFGARACEQICKLTEGATLEDVLFDETIALPVELDQATLSNGEKQVFIMALYQSLIGLSKHEVPFVIDTPFARIDTEHRENFSEHFFSKLKGQIFVLSTNEEINEKHMAILQNKINRTFILENADNKKTLVTMNRYFEGSL